MLTHDVVETSQRIRTPEGYLKVPAVFARSGIYEYTAGQIGHPDKPSDDTVKVFRPADEVFAPESMESFGRKPVTNEHPSKPVTLDNIKQVAVGWSGDAVVRDGPLMRGSLLITDKAAIEAIEAGKRELSNGYSADYEFLPGITPEGQAFDAIQRNMRGNHIAIVDRGRCGTVCAVADKDKESTMTKITIDGVECEVEDKIAKAIEKANADAKAALELAEKAEKDVADILAKQKDRDLPKGEEPEEDEEEEEDNEEQKKHGEDKALAKAEAARDAALAKVPTQDQIDQQVEVRAQVVGDAQRLVPGIKIKGKTNEAIRREVVDSKIQDDLSEKSDAYIEARFDSLAEGGGESRRFAERNFKTDGKGSMTADEKIATARQKYIDDTANAWKGAEAS